MTSHPAYRPAKSGSLPDARKLVYDILPKPYRFTHLKGFVCPVLKPSGNKIPLALAEIFSQNADLELCTSVLLKHSAHSNAMIGRLHYHPEFSGEIQPGNYVIVDDVYTSGVTLISLKLHIESQGGVVTTAFTLGSSKSTNFKPNKLMLKILISRFPDIHRYFDLDLLTAPQIVYMLRFPSLQAVHDRFYNYCLDSFFS
jgi:hypothetical protein